MRPGVGCNHYNYVENEPQTAAISKFRQASANNLDSMFTKNLIRVESLDTCMFFMMISVCSTWGYRTIIHFTLV